MERLASFLLLDPLVHMLFSDLLDQKMLPVKGFLSFGSARDIIMTSFFFLYFLKPVVSKMVLSIILDNLYLFIFKSCAWTILTHIIKHRQKQILKSRGNK